MSDSQRTDAASQLTAWTDDTALTGPNAPKWNGQLEHLIRYLLTVYKRFGNTAITANLQFGGNALHKRDEQKEYIEKLERELAAALKAKEELQQWVHDLQSGMYINCVYCGHRYGPQDTVPSTMADALKVHIEGCEKHPMSALKKAKEEAERTAKRYQVLRQGINLLCYEYSIGNRLTDETIDAVIDEAMKK